MNSAQLSMSWAETALEGALSELHRVVDDDVAAFRQTLAASGLELVPGWKGSTWIGGPRGGDGFKEAVVGIGWRLRFHN